MDTINIARILLGLLVLTFTEQIRDYLQSKGIRHFSDKLLRWIKSVKRNLKWNQQNSCKQRLGHLSERHQLKLRHSLLRIAREWVACSSVAALKERARNLMDGQTIGYHTVCNCCDHPTWNMDYKLKEGDFMDVIQLMNLDSIMLTSMYLRVMSMRVDSKLFYRDGAYWISNEILKSAYTLANGHVSQKSFVDSDYYVQKRRLKRKLKAKSCDNPDCDFVGRLRPCTGCMGTAYCSTRCQKLDWKTRHRTECDWYWEMKVCHILTPPSGSSMSTEIIGIDRMDNGEGICIGNGVDRDILVGASEIVAEKMLVFDYAFGSAEKYCKYDGFQIKRRKGISKYEMVSSMCRILRSLEFIREHDMINKIIKRDPRFFSVVIA